MFYSLLRWHKFDWFFELHGHGKLEQHGFSAEYVLNIIICIFFFGIFCDYGLFHKWKYNSLFLILLKI